MRVILFSIYPITNSRINNYKILCISASILRKFVLHANELLFIRCQSEFVSSMKFENDVISRPYRLLLGFQALRYRYYSSIYISLWYFQTPHRQGAVFRGISFSDIWFTGYIGTTTGTIRTLVKWKFKTVGKGRVAAMKISRDHACVVLVCRNEKSRFRFISEWFLRKLY